MYHWMREGEHTAQIASTTQGNTETNETTTIHTNTHTHGDNYDACVNSKTRVPRGNQHQNSTQKGTMTSPGFAWDLLTVRQQP